MNLKLLLLFISANFASSFFDPEMLKDVILSFTSYYQSTCIRFLHKSNISSTGFENRFYFKIYKALSKHTPSKSGLYPNLTISLYSYDTYIRIRLEPGYKASCSKPLKVVIADKGSSGEFARVSTELTATFSMSNSVWVFFMDNVTVYEFFDRAKLPIDTEFIVVKIKNSSYVDFEEAYRVAFEYPIRVLYFGNWTKQTGLNISKEHMFTRRSNMEKLLFRTGSMENWPVSSFRNGTLDGLFPRIWNEVADRLNISSEHTMSPYNSMGRKMSNGTYSGLVGMLVRDEIDVIVSDLTINEERSDVLSFSHPILSSNYQVYFKYIGNNLEWTAVFKPFGWSLWVAIITWLLAGSLCLTLCHYLSLLFGLKYERDKIFRPAESFFIILQSLCQQGYAKVPRAAPFRIIFLVTYLLAAVLIPSYSASLISSLAYQTPIKPFNSLREMLNDGRYKLIVGRHTAEYTYFADAKEGIYQEVMEKLIKTVPKTHSLNSTANEIKRILCEWPNYAMFGVEKIVSMRIDYGEDQMCKITSFTRPLAVVHQSFGLRKKSPYTNLINYHLNKMFDAGIIGRIATNLFRKLDNTLYQSYKRVELDEIFHYFLFLTSGIILASVFLLFEKIYSRPKKNSLSSQNRKNIKMKKFYQYHFYLEY